MAAEEGGTWTVPLAGQPPIRCPKCGNLGMDVRVHFGPLKLEEGSPQEGELRIVKSLGDVQRVEAICPNCGQKPDDPAPDDEEDLQT
jgi:predicted RNA-binding Zn-ribbon protein involved in translation (DUF1610 family)